MIGGNKWIQSDWAVNSSTSSGLTSLPRLNRYMRWTSFELMSKCATRQSVQDDLRKVMVLLKLSKVMLLPLSVTLELKVSQMPPKRKWRWMERPAVSFAKTMVAVSLCLNLPSNVRLLRLPAIITHLPSKWWTSTRSEGRIRSSQGRGADWLMAREQRRRAALKANIFLYHTIAGLALETAPRPAWFYSWLQIFKSCHPQSSLNYWRNLVIVICGKILFEHQVKY